MLRISFQTLRARRGTLAGAFVAIWLAVTLAYGTGLLMDGALSAPGPGRFAAAEAVAARQDRPIRRMPAPRLDAALVRASRAASATSPSRSARGRAVARLGSEPLHAHGWASAALTPYRLTSGRAPSGPREVVADERLAAGARVRVATPAGEATLPRHRHRPRPGRPADAVLRRRDRRPPVGHAGLVNAIAAPSREAAERLRAAVARHAAARRAAARAPTLAPRRLPPSRCSTATTRPTPTPATPAPPTVRRSSRSSGRWAGSPARSRCSSSPARSRWRSPSGGARSPCCARSAPRRIRSGG